MTLVQLENELLNSYHGLVLLDAYAERSFFYNPHQTLPKGMYFATIKANDSPNDKASALNRENIYRLNFGVSKTTYENLFGKKPARPQKGGIVTTGHDFTKLNELTPHPIYAWLHWVAILNPNQETMPLIKELLNESYVLIQKKYVQKMKQQPKQ
jgi:Family of unknown function (DUF6194)